MADIEKNEGAVSSSKNKAESKPAPAKKDKVPFTKKVGKFFREYKSELKKVVWATRQQTINNTVLVVVSVVIVSICIGVLDYAFSTGLTALGKLI